ncbi:MAG: hypothetical protein H6509_04125 [Bryobacterales bacterium]|nr:hypothetical protein [Bryobacterales bacterium]
MTLAASENTFRRIFNAVRDEIVFEKADSGSFGPFTAGYDIKFHLENGSVDLRGDNTVLVKELDIKWDRLDLSLGFDIPEICVGGFCIIPTPFGCALRAPRICIFSADPDVQVTLPLGGFTSELSLAGTLETRYFVDPARPAGMDDWQAQEAVPPLYNRWQLFLDPQWVDVDLIDIADTVGDLLENAVEAVVDGALGFLPGWARDLIKAILGPVIDLIRAILDIPDDIQEWISDLLNVSFGLLDIIAQFILDYFANRNELTHIEDPYPILGATQDPNDPTRQLVPVKIPIRDLTVFNDDLEMVLEGNIG